MLRNYLYQISNIIHDAYKSNTQCITGCANMDHTMGQVIRANNIVLKMVKKSKLKLLKPHRSEFRQSGSGIEELSASITTLTQSMQALLDNMTTMDKSSGEMLDHSKEITEIAGVGIQLIQFLGELIEKSTSDNKKITEIQAQVAKIVLDLGAYLEPPKPV